MAGQVINLFVLIAIGVMLADMLASGSQTQALFNGVAKLWQIGVNGMLGKTTS